MSGGNFTMPTLPTQRTLQSPFSNNAGGLGGPMRGSWPGQGYGGMPGRFQPQPMYAPGQAFGSPGGVFGGSRFGASGMDNPYGPGSYSSPGAMPYGGGAGQVSAGRSGALTAFPGASGASGMTYQPTGVVGDPMPQPFQGFGQMPDEVRPLQMIRPYLDYRSPFGAGSATAYRAIPGYQTGG